MTGSALLCKKLLLYTISQKYLGAGVYWDNGSDVANQRTYTLDGTTYHAGLMDDEEAIYTDTPAGNAAGARLRQPISVNTFFSCLLQATAS